MTTLALFLLLLPSGMNRGAFALMSTTVLSSPVQDCSDCACVDCKCCQGCPVLDYSKGYVAAKACKKSLYVAKGVSDVAAEKAKADSDHAIFCVTERSEFPDGVTIYDYRDGGLFKRPAPVKEEVRLESFEETCSDGSCGGASSIEVPVKSSGGFRLFRGNSCSSCN